MLERIGWAVTLILSLILSGLILEAMFDNWKTNPGNPGVDLMVLFQGLDFMTDPENTKTLKYQISILVKKISKTVKYKHLKNTKKYF